MTTTTRPPFPRWTLVWTAADWQAPSSDALAAFTYDRTTGADAQGIRATNASMSAWRECAMAWTRAAGYDYGHLHAAREIATGTTPESCAAVAVLEDGRAVAIPAASLEDTAQGWGMTPSEGPTRPGRHSNYLSGTPETHEALEGAP